MSGVDRMILTTSLKREDIVQEQESLKVSPRKVNTTTTVGLCLLRRLWLLLVASTIYIMYPEPLLPNILLECYTTR